jgi:hypothetical protein
VTTLLRSCLLAWWHSGFVSLMPRTLLSAAPIQNYCQLCDARNYDHPCDAMGTAGCHSTHLLLRAIQEGRTHVRIGAADSLVRCLLGAWRPNVWTASALIWLRAGPITGNIARPFRLDFKVDPVQSVRVLRGMRSVAFNRW